MLKWKSLGVADPRVRKLGLLAGLPLLVAGLTLGACGSDDKGDKASKGATTPTSADSTPTSAGSAAAGDGAVAIDTYMFKPSPVTVKAGTAVTWTNKDDGIHSIKDTSSLATPVSKDLGKGDTFSITYGKPGSYAYICGIHNYMAGTVEVTG